MRWSSAADELPLLADDSEPSDLEADLTLETLLCMVEHVMRDLPRDGNTAVPGLADDLLDALPDAMQPPDDPPLPERLRRVESILRSLAQVLLATV